MSARLLRDRRGTAALEFAVAGTVVLVLMLAIYDVGMLFMAQRGLDFGVDKAARWGVVNSASVTTANVLAQFQSASSVMLGNTTCQGFASGATIPAGTACYVTVGLSNGAQVGSLLTIVAKYSWAPASTITGITAVTLQSTVALTIQN